MKRETEEWVKKAEGDWRTMLRESVVKDGPNYDAVCFHAQQCAEKYLKALLFESGLSFRKIHDLAKLLNDLLPSYPALAELNKAAVALTAFGVEFRYPGEDAQKEDAEDALEYCTQIRAAVRKILHLHSI